MTLITVGSVSFFAERVSYVVWAEGFTSAAAVYLDHSSADGPVRLFFHRDRVPELREQLDMFRLRVKVEDFFNLPPKED